MNITMKRSDEHTNILDQLKSVKFAQESLLTKMRVIKTNTADCDILPKVDFKGEFNYKDRVFLRDLTTEEQRNLGIGIYYAKIHKTTSSPIHEHGKSAQLIYVKQGTIFDKTSKIMFKKGESFFVSRKNEHSIKYLKGSEVLFIYMPALGV